jgi:broad specificity phosphatase PhoE
MKATFKSIVFTVLIFSVHALADQYQKLSEIPGYSESNRLCGIGALKNRYIVVRHGQAAINVPPHFCTSREADETMFSDLTEKGREQAAKAGVTLRQKEIPIEDVIVLSSPFKRAVQTAGMIAHRLNVKAEVHEALRERFLGIHDQFLVTPERLEQIEGIDHVDPWHTRGNVESVMATMERLTTLVRELEESHSGKTIILVSHWHPAAILMNSFEGHVPGKRQEIENAVPYELSLHSIVANRDGSEL